MIRLRHREKWWYGPKLPKRIRPRPPSSTKHIDPLDKASHQLLQKPRKSTGSFSATKDWVRYNRLQSVDVGYIVPLYNMREIGKRYGLSRNAQIYFKRHILPPPFEIVRVRSTQAHHYSQFVLWSLDAVLEDLQRLGRSQFLRAYEDHVKQLHVGVGWLAGYYEERVQYADYQSEDHHGVVWYQ